MGDMFTTCFSGMGHPFGLKQISHIHNKQPLVMMDGIFPTPTPPTPPFSPFLFSFFFFLSPDRSHWWEVAVPVL